MYFLFNIFILAQIATFLEIYAEENIEKIDKINSIKWERLEDNKPKNPENIIWKSYNNDEGYFEKELIDEPSVKKNIKIDDKNISSFDKKSIFLNTEIEPYLPLNNFLNPGNFQTNVRWKSSFDGGVSGGIGQQNPSFSLDYGLSESSLISFYITGADDDLYNLVDGQKINYYWQNYAVSFKKKLFEEDKIPFSLSITSTLDYWRIASGSETTKSIYNQLDNSYGKDKFDNLIGTFSLSFSKEINDKLILLFVPGYTFLPEKLGNKGTGKNSYGNNFYLGTGFVMNLSEQLRILASYTSPLGPGNNYFDNNLKYSRKSLYSFGVGFDFNERIGLEGKITNSFGSSPATGLLTIPTDNISLYTANLIYRPYEKDKYLKPLSKIENLISQGGIFVSNALLPKSGTSQIRFNYDSEGNLFGSYSYSLSNIFQLELLNIGNFKDVNLSNNNNENLSSTYLSKNNLNFRLGGKLMIYSPQKDDLFWMTLRTSVGRNANNNQGYLFSELINTFKINDRLAFNISPKYFYSGVESFGGLGISSYINLFENLQLIPELNTSFKISSDLNSSIALRYSYVEGRSIDLYYSNAVGTQDIGTILKDKENRIGIKLNFTI